MTERLKAPFPYFGGKSRIAHRVWAALGQPAHYIEPFFGSGAVLLSRPHYNPARHTETVNDKDGFIANVWRAMKWAPDEVAKYCDWPVNHADLHARRKRVLESEGTLLRNLLDDEEWFDAKIAGYWIWGVSCSIANAFTTPRKDETPICGIPLIGAPNQGVVSQSGTSQFNALSERLRKVRVACGDWSIVCGGDWQDRSWENVGIFFDPPYGVTDRDTKVYRHDDTETAKDVLDWCRERGSRNNYRIVVAGYEEYQELVDQYGWTFESWKTNCGYASQGTLHNENKHRERLYLSPHCNRQADLFSGAVDGAAS